VFESQLLLNLYVEVQANRANFPILSLVLNTSTPGRSCLLIPRGGGILPSTLGPHNFLPCVSPCMSVPPCVPKSRQNHALQNVLCTVFLLYNHLQYRFEHVSFNFFFLISTSPSFEFKNLFKNRACAKRTRCCAECFCLTRSGACACTDFF
jgi:hypothetical protein